MPPGHIRGQGTQNVYTRVNSHPIPPPSRRAPVPTALEMAPEPAILRRSAAAKFTHTGNADSAGRRDLRVGDPVALVRGIDPCGHRR
jgi:hypothetical protein